MPTPTAKENVNKKLEETYIDVVVQAQCEAILKIMGHEICPKYGKTL